MLDPTKFEEFRAAILSEYHDAAIARNIYEVTAIVLPEGSTTELDQEWIVAKAEEVGIPYNSQRVGD